MFFKDLFSKSQHIRDVSGTGIRVPKERELMVINTNAPKQSKA
jgi:hypothetical protein